MTRKLHIVQYLTSFLPPPHSVCMEQEQVQCPDCKVSYTRLLSSWKFCPFCGNHSGSRGLGTGQAIKRKFQEPCALKVDEVVSMTGFSRRTVIRLFEAEKGVIILERPEKMHKRRFRSLRIPHAVYERVVARTSVR